MIIILFYSFSENNFLKLSKIYILCIKIIINSKIRLKIKKIIKKFQNIKIIYTVYSNF